MKPLTPGERELFAVALVAEWRFRRQYEETQDAMMYSAYDAHECVLRARYAAEFECVEGEALDMLRDMLGDVDANQIHVKWDDSTLFELLHNYGAEAVDIDWTGWELAAEQKTDRPCSMCNGTGEVFRGRHEGYTECIACRRNARARSKTNDPR